MTRSTLPSLSFPALLGALALLATVLAAPAAAHHGNPEAPAPKPWYEDSLPQPPQGPAQP